MTHLKNTPAICTFQYTKTASGSEHHSHPIVRFFKLEVTGYLDFGTMFYL